MVRSSPRGGSTSHTSDNDSGTLPGFPLKLRFRVLTLSQLLRFSLPRSLSSPLEFRPLVAIQVQYDGVSTGRTQNMGFSNLTPPHFTSKVALELADLVHIARGHCPIAAAGYAVHGVVHKYRCPPSHVD